MDDIKQLLARQNAMLESMHTNQRIIIEQLSAFSRATGACVEEQFELMSHDELLEFMEGE